MQLVRFGLRESICIVRAGQRRETLEPIELRMQLGHLKGQLAMHLQIHEGQRPTLLRGQSGLFPGVHLLGILSRFCCLFSLPFVRLGRLAAEFLFSHRLFSCLRLIFAVTARFMAVSVASATCVLVFLVDAFDWQITGLLTRS